VSPKITIQENFLTFGPLIQSIFIDTEHFFDSIFSEDPSFFTHWHSHNLDTLPNTMKFTTAVFLSALSTASAFAPSNNAKFSTSLNAVLLPKTTGQSALDPNVIAKYDSLAFPEDSVLAEYVWVDGEGNTRSKTRTLTADKTQSVDQLPKWNYDGSSTGQAPGDDSEVILKPQRIFADPFRPRSDGVKNILVMCDTYTPAGEPIESNTRAIGKF
jgi:glutamine synthetase